MSLLNSLSIKTKILSLAGVAVIGFIVSILVNTNMNTANSERLQTIQKTFFPVVEISKANLVRLSRLEELFSTAVSTGEMDFVNAAEKVRKEVTDALAKLETIWPERAGEVQLTGDAFNAYFTAAKKLSAGMIDGTLEPSAMSSSINTMNKALVAARKLMQQYSEDGLQAFNDTVAKSNEAAQNALSIGLVVTLVTLVFLAFVAWSTSNSINTAVNSLLMSLKDIASGEGDLTQRISKSSNDEIGEVVD